MTVSTTFLHQGWIRLTYEKDSSPFYNGSSVTVSPRGKIYPQRAFPPESIPELIEVLTEAQRIAESGKDPHTHNVYCTCGRVFDTVEDQEEHVITRRNNFGDFEDEHEIATQENTV